MRVRRNYEWDVGREVDGSLLSRLDYRLNVRRNQLLASVEEGDGLVHQYELGWMVGYWIMDQEINVFQHSK
jgi:hypothetical protein